GFFEDREGNLWLATSKGLDRLRESPVVTFSTPEGLSPGHLGAMLASNDGTIWIGGAETLDALRQESVTSTRFGGRSVNALWQDHAGRLWVGLENILTVYEHGRFREINRLNGRPLGTPIAITEDREQNIWVTVGITTASERKLFRIPDLRVQEGFASDRRPLKLSFLVTRRMENWSPFPGRKRQAPWERMRMPKVDSPACRSMRTVRRG